MHTPPSEINGAAVKVCGSPAQVISDPLTARNETFVTVGPTAEDDERLWEFSLTTGRLIQTRGGTR